MKKNHNVYLLCRVSGTLPEKAEELGIEVFCYDFKKHLLKSFKKFKNIISKHQIDVVHSNELTTSILQGVFLKGMQNGKTTNVCTCHGQWYNLSKLKKILIQNYIKHIYCVSNVVQENLNNQKIVNTSISYLGVPQEKYKLSYDGKDDIKSQYKISENTIIVITVARFQKIKSQLKGVQAIEKLLNRGYDIRYFLIGDSIYNNSADAAYKDEVCKYIETHKLNEHISLLGERNDIPKLMAASDYIMITSDNESFGMVAIEAIASSRIVVSTPCDGVCEIMENNEIMISKDNSAEGLCNILSKLLDSEEFRNKAKEKIISLQEKFTVEEVCKKYVYGYLNCLQ